MIKKVVKGLLVRVASVYIGLTALGLNGLLVEHSANRWGLATVVPSMLLLGVAFYMVLVTIVGTFKIN